MTGKIKRRSLRCGGRPKADFGSIFTSVIAPTLNAAGAITDSAIDKHKTPTSGVVNSNTVIPSDPTKTPTMRLGGRKKCWIGAAIGAATSIAGSLFGAGAKKREMRRQQSIQDWQNATQEATAMSTALNNSQDYQEDYLRQFRTAARLGKRLGAKGIYITDGGDATKIDNNTYLLRGGSHEDVNETGQTGIGINVGGNEVEAEGGEVAQKKNGALRIFSAQPILGNGMSPAQAILRGYNKDKVFNAQQQFKKRNGLKDDGGKAAFGDLITGAWNFLKQPRLPIHNIAALATAYQKFYPTSNYNKQKGKFGGGKGFNGAGAGGTWTDVKPATRKFNNFNDAYDDAVNRGASTFKFGNKLYNTKAEGNPIRELNNRAVGSYRDTIMVKDRGKNYGVDFGPIKSPATLIPLVYDTYDKPRKRHKLGGGLTFKDRGSSKHPYPSVSSKDFAGRGRSYPIPTKADAVDALRLAGLHGRSDVKAKVYSRYPELRPKAAFGDWVRTNRDDNALADLLYESGLFDRESWNTMLRDIHDFTGMGGDPYNTDENVDAVMAPAFGSSSTRVLSQLAKSPEASYTLKQVLGLPTKEMVRKRIAGDIAKRIGVARAARQSSNFRNYNIARMQAANAEASFSPFANQVRYAEGKPVLVNTNGYYTTARNTISRNAKNMTSGANPFLYAPKTSDEVLEGLNRVIASAKQGAKLKGVRPRAFIGRFVPYNKRYTPIYDAPDYGDYDGGNALGNKEVTVTAKRIKPTFMKPNNDAMNIINHPANETPYIPQKYNRSRTIFSGGDYLGLGIDTLSALGTGLVNYKTAGNYVLPDRAPVIQASKLPTTYNVSPEIEEVKRYRDRLTGETYANTSSSVAALNRGNNINLAALSNLSKLWATKENEENKMLTEDAKNQQAIAAQNAQNELARQSEIARIKNEAIQVKGEALNVGLSGLSQAWTNFWTAGRTAYEDDQSRRAMIASSKEATPTRLMEMNFDLSPDVIASLYKTTKDDRTKRFYLSRLSPKQRQRYGIN